jgi:hypothetical protein
LRPNPEPAIFSKDFQHRWQAVHDLVSRNHNPRKLKDLASYSAVAAALLLGFVKSAGIKRLQAFG